jgi:hypothetical protein
MLLEKGASVLVVHCTVLSAVALCRNNVNDPAYFGLVFSELGWPAVDKAFALLLNYVRDRS